MVPFGGAEVNVDFEKARVVILPVPYDRTVTYRKGGRYGPAAIIEASQYMELFDEELNYETMKIGIHTAEPLKLEKASPEEMAEAVYNSVKPLFAADKLPVLLGGEHSVSIGAVKAAKEQFGDLTVVQFDAHHDLRNEYEGSAYNHACVGRRISEIAPLIQCGVRSISKEEKEFLGAAQNIRVVTPYTILEDQAWDIKALEWLGEHVYITIDLDALDPAIMPAVGVPEPGGFGWYILLDFLRKIAGKTNVVGFDVVELAPLEGNIAPDYLASRLIFKLIGYIWYYKNRGKEGRR